MRQLQKGNQAAQRSDCRRNWLSRVLILRTLRKANHRVPEETQASSAQDDRIATPSDIPSRNNGPRLTGPSSPRLFPTAESIPPPNLSKFQTPARSRLATFWYLPAALHLDRTRNPATSLYSWRVGQPNHPPHMAGSAADRMATGSMQWRPLPTAVRVCLSFTNPS